MKSLFNFVGKAFSPLGVSKLLKPFAQSQASEQEQGQGQGQGQGPNLPKGGGEPTPSRQSQNEDVRQIAPVDILPESRDAEKRMQENESLAKAEFEAEKQQAISNTNAAIRQRSEGLAADARQRSEGLAADARQRSAGLAADARGAKTESVNSSYGAQLGTISAGNSADVESKKTASSEWSAGIKQQITQARTELGEPKQNMEISK